MSKYNVTFHREFTVEIEAEDLTAAQQHARGVVERLSGKLLSIETQKKGRVVSPRPKPQRQNHPR